jgi:hypothetical protein
MEKTVTLDQDVAEQIEQAVRRQGTSMQALVNEALRLHLGLAEQRRPAAPFRVVAHDFGFLAGVDLDKMNRLADELEGEELARNRRVREAAEKL